MALQSMTALASITLQEASASVTFSGIPQNYRDLVLVVSGTASAGQTANLYLNGDTTSSNYSRVFMLGTGSATSSEAAASAGCLSISTTQSVAISNIIDYSATNKHKTILTRANATSDFVVAFANRWANTVAVTSVSAQTATGTFSLGSTFNLYGRIA
jgi:hypothetical protein